MTGRLVAIVGPSGVGKDSVMAGVARAMPGLAIVRRVITRAPGLGGEDYLAVTAAEFAAQKNAGAFCLDWCAHGLSYGIPDSARVEVRAGQDRLVNLSRSVLVQAQAIFPELLVINLTARPETLAARIAARGRESAADVAKRLDRAVPDFAPGLDVRNVSNDGALAQTVHTVLNHLEKERV